MSPNWEKCVTVGVCETQPLLIDGLRAALESSRAFTLINAVTSLEEAGRMVVADSPRILLIDKALGTPAILDVIARMPSTSATHLVVWGSAMTEGEAARLLSAGAKGVLRKTVDSATLLACFEAVCNGSTWLENSIFHGRRIESGPARSQLTPREQQVLELVEQGLRNKEIGREMGISPGTVKIHLKHVFEKTGVRGRYGLAISGLRQRQLANSATAAN